MAMTGTSGFQANGSSLESEEGRSGFHVGGGGSLPRVEPNKSIINNAKKNFGRNTLYNPKPKSDLLEIFPAGDALATSQAAANLIRPTNKPESR